MKTAHLLLLITALLGLANCSKRVDEAAPAVPEPVATCATGSSSACRQDCDKGDNKACENLTAMYLQGRGVTKSARKAALLNKRLCESGRKYFCPSYAFVLALGRGVARDVVKARSLFKATCRFDAVACSEYGSLFAGGRGVDKDLDFATFLLELACQSKNAAACRDLNLIRKSRTTR